jgi:hypothetical protein
MRATAMSKADDRSPPYELFSEILQEVAAEFNRTFENLGPEAEIADYAADVVSLLSFCYLGGESG